jgi:hypothetical protein
LLTDLRCCHLAIIDIAFASGFGDVSHFNRVFRRHHGDTPSGVQAAAMGNFPRRRTRPNLPGGPSSQVCATVAPPEAIVKRPLREVWRGSLISGRNPPWYIQSNGNGSPVLPQIEQ